MEFLRSFLRLHFEGGSKGDVAKWCRLVSQAKIIFDLKDLSGESILVSLIAFYKESSGVDFEVKEILTKLHKFSCILGLLLV